MFKRRLKYGCKISQLNSFIVPVVCIIFIVSLMVFSKTAVSSALKGIDLWINVVFPSLFPFLVASEILSGTNFIKAVGFLLEPIMRPLFKVPGCASFPLAIGMTSGYPVGAKVIASMKENNLISKPEAERLLAFCNNSSPLFVTGAVAVGMLKMPNVGPFLLLCHIAAGISVGLIFRFFSKNQDLGPRNYVSKHTSKGNNTLKDFGGLLGSAVKNSVMSLLHIGGFIILFSVIISLLIECGIIGIFIRLLYPFLKFTGQPEELFTSLAGGFIEITTGIRMLTSFKCIPLNVKLIALSAILGWGGISVHMQIFSIVNNYGLSVRIYMFGKLLQSILAALYTYIMIIITGGIPQPVMFIFKQSNINSQELITWSQYLLASSKHVMIVLFILTSFIVLAILFSLFNNQLVKISNKYK